MLSRSRPVLAGLALALAATLPGSGPVAANTRDTATDTPVDCPSTTHASEITEGMLGTGWTVVRGTEPQPFGAEILGVFPDGIGAGHDLILFRAFDVDGGTFIDTYGGLWAGMSGSPVYIDGKLIGAVSYGFSSATSTLGGITPIDDMLAVADRLGTSTTSSGTASRVSAAVRRAVAAAEPSAQASRFKPILTPAQLPMVAVPRLRASAEVRARNVSWLRPDAVAGILPVGGTARVQIGPASPGPLPVAGGNLAAIASSGLVSTYGVGTTTWVCGDRLLAFGHPMAWTGRVGYAMMDARAFDIVDDATAGPYKLAVPTDLLGRVTQDRRTAIAGRLDLVPTPLTTITTHYTEGETSSARTTYVYPGLDTSGLDIMWRLNLALAHGTSAFRSGADQSTVAGTLRFTTTVEGRRADGSPYSVTFADRLWGDPLSNGTPFYYADEVAGIVVAYPAAWMLLNPWENVTVDSVTTTLDRAPVARWLLEDVKARVNGGAWRSGTVRARKGDRLDIRITLAGLTGRTMSPAPTATRTTRTASLVVTSGMVGRTIWPSVQSTFLDRLLMSGPYEESSFDEYLSAVDHQSRQDEVYLVMESGRTLATLSTGRIVQGYAQGVRILLRD